MPRGCPDFVDVGRDFAPRVASANQRKLGSFIVNEYLHSHYLAAVISVTFKPGTGYVDVESKRQTYLLLISITHVCLLDK